MVLWRIDRFASIAGHGGLVVEGRWSRVGRPVVYLSDAPASCLLEFLVHLEIGVAELPKSYTLLEVDVPLTKRHITSPARLPKSWRADLAWTQTYGARWLEEAQSPLLRVPSAIVPETWNYLLNPLHPHTKARIARVIAPAIDPRLFSPRRATLPNA